MVWGFDDLRKGAVLHISEAEVLISVVCNEGLLGHYPGGDHLTTALSSQMSSHPQGALHVLTYNLYVSVPTSTEDL